jgi:MoaA/NifB/PqqE/SkfB family radical SAM enzyme
VNDAIARLKGSGLARLAISFDGPTAQVHDTFRRVPGSYDCTPRAAHYAREIDLLVQVNTTITRHNLPLINDMIDMLAHRPRSSKRDARRQKRRLRGGTDKSGWNLAAIGLS